jgi:hypothetical protein
MTHIRSARDYSHKVETRIRRRDWRTG